MSNIIKAAELEVLVADDEQVIIRSFDKNTTEQAATAEPVTGTISHANNVLEEAQKKAKDIIAKANIEADELRKECAEELDALRQKSYAEGFDNGYATGETQAKENVSNQVRELVTTLEETLQSAGDMRARALQRHEDDFLKLSIILAEKVIRKEIADDPFWLKPIVHEALERLGYVERCVIRLSVDEHEALHPILADLQLGESRKISFEPDATLTTGSFTIDSDNGMVDARLEHRLGKIAHSLLDILYEDEQYERPS